VRNIPRVRFKPPGCGDRVYFLCEIGELQFPRIFE
jgi:hypothetical protein